MSRVSSDQCSGERALRELRAAVSTCREKQQAGRTVDAIEAQIESISGLLSEVERFDAGSVEKILSILSATIRKLEASFDRISQTRGEWSNNSTPRRSGRVGGLSAGQ